VDAQKRGPLYIAALVKKLTEDNAARLADPLASG
jgi:hypothetical protein